METNAAYIAYWLDRTSDASDPRWVVSLEEDDISTTLRVMPLTATEHGTRAIADTIGLERGLPVERA